MLSRYVLEKTHERGKRFAVLQGNSHVAPSPWFARLQKDIDKCSEEGYVICYEGLPDAPDISLRSANAKGLYKLLGPILVESYGATAKNQGKTYQSHETEGISYPPGSINADVAMQQLVNMIDERGIRCPVTYPMMPLALWANKHWSKACTVQKVLLWCLFTILKPIAHIHLWLYRSLFEKAWPVFVDYRNEIAFIEATTKSSGKDIFLLYGEKHIPGLLQLFQNDGWSVKKFAVFDPNNL